MDKFSEVDIMGLKVYKKKEKKKRQELLEKNQPTFKHETAQKKAKLRLKKVQEIIHEESESNLELSASEQANKSRSSSSDNDDEEEDEFNINDPKLKDIDMLEDEDFTLE